MQKKNPTFASPPEFVTTSTELEQMFERLMQTSRVAVDTESNSLYAYEEQVCLLQFSIPGIDYLVDPLALDDLRPLAPFFASSEIEKVFHAADYDLIVLKRDFDFTCGKLFDTMWAGRVLGWRHVGLGSVLEKHFDLHLDKKFQRYNWGKRPLSDKAIAYGRMDTHYLLELRDLQQEALESLGRWQEAQEIFEYLRTTTSIPPERDPKETFWSLKGLHRLNHKEKRVMYGLHLWRERTAERLDRPPFKVMGRKQLLSLAHTRPRDKRGLRASGLSHYQIRKYGRELLHLLRGQPRTLPSQPNGEPEPSNEVKDRYESLRSWRRDVARMRGVDSDVILPNATLWELAEDPPADVEALLDVPGIGPWRKENYGPDLIALLQHT
jgi:ribonuclease D